MTPLPLRTTRSERRTQGGQPHQNTALGTVHLLRAIFGVTRRKIFLGVFVLGPVLVSLFFLMLSSRGLLTANYLVNCAKMLGRAVAKTKGALFCRSIKSCLLLS